MAERRYPIQDINNAGADSEFSGFPMREGVGYDGQSLQKNQADAMATKITVSGDDTYIGVAKPGTAQATAKWRCKKISVSGGTTVITWADSGNYSQVATDLTALSYS